MLIENTQVSQEKDSSGYRRWFTDKDLDLIVWYANDNEIDGFQLCYDKTESEHSITWLKDKGYSHNKIDTGESVPGEFRTPILVADGMMPLEKILKDFESKCEKIDYKLAKFILDKLKNMPSDLIENPS